MTQLETNIIRHIAGSRSNNEYLSKVMKDVEELSKKADTQRKSEALIKDIVFAYQVYTILDYSHLKNKQLTLGENSELSRF